MNDEILKMLQYMELKIDNQSKEKLSYQFIINEPIIAMVPIKLFPYKFNVPNMEKYK